MFYVSTYLSDDVALCLKYEYLDCNAYGAVYVYVCVIITIRVVK